MNSTLWTVHKIYYRNLPKNYYYYGYFFSNIHLHWKIDNSDRKFHAIHYIGSLTLNPYSTVPRLHYLISICFKRPSTVIWPKSFLILQVFFFQNTRKRRHVTSRNCYFYHLATVQMKYYEGEREIEQCNLSCSSIQRSIVYNSW